MLREHDPREATVQKVLVHVAMVLLGVTLSVGFYEGRRLVKNTAKALTAATTLSTTGGRHAAREGLAGEGEDEAEAAAAAEEGIPNKTRLDPSQLEVGRVRARPHAALPGGVGEPDDPLARGKRRGGRRGGKAERLERLGDPTARAKAKLGALDEAPPSELTPVDELEGAPGELPEDTAVPQ